MKYWKTFQKDIILNYLGPIAKLAHEFIIWQQFGEKRVTYKGKLTKASRELCKIKILDSDLVKNFKDDSPFYIHIKEFDIIFKKDHYTQMGQFIEFSLPSDIQIYEKRKTKRFYYQYQDHKNITYHSEQKKLDNGEPVFTNASVLVDISTQGAGLVVSRDDVSKLSIDQILFLDNLTDQELPAPFKVRIKYIETYKHKEAGLYKIGIIFDDELNSISFKSITSIIDVKQRKTQGLSRDKYCGLDDGQQLQTLNKIELSNKVLANNMRDNIEFLDTLRYLTTQMKVEFLKEVNQDLLAVALRLSSKELVYELFSELTKTRQDEFIDKLQNERPASAVCKAQDQIIKLIREKEKCGEIVLDPKSFVTYV